MIFEVNDQTIAELLALNITEDLEREAAVFWNGSWNNILQMLVTAGLARETAMRISEAAGRRRAKFLTSTERPPLKGLTEDLEGEILAILEDER